jgi:CSLREA domain-containing protein
MSMKRKLGGAEHLPALGKVGTGHMPIATTSYWRPLALLVCFALAASVMMAVVLASPAQAAEPLIVNSSTDSNDGACTTDPEGCTLREAIDAANASAGQADTIEFDLGQSATIPLCQVHCNGSEYGLGALPVITDSAGLTIDGQSADITINGDYSGGYGFAVVVFWVGSGAGLDLNNLTVTKGIDGVFNEGTLTVHDTTFSGNIGEGSIRNSGTATVNDSTFSGNIGDSGVPGGGIMNESGTATVNGSTFSNNSAGIGGGIFFYANSSGPKTTVTNSTISGNNADGGGGISVWGDGTLEVSNSTISGNSAGTSSGGAIYSSGTTTVNSSTITDNTATDAGGMMILGSANFKNTIVAGNTATNPASPDNCALRGSLGDNGHNLESGTDCFFGAPSSLRNTDPMLGPLADNGGPTKTRALLEGSPAIDQGYSFGTSADQRGQTRPSDFLGIPNASGGDASDIGAFEAQAPTLAVAPGGSCATNDRSGTINLTVNDQDGPAESLTLSASSSKPALVSNSNVTFGGTGADRTLTATAASGKSGTAVLTVTVTDGQQIKGAPLTVKVRVGGNGNDTLAGDTNPDILFGQNANDTLRGAAGKDLLCGGRGDDRLRGGTEADFFGGGAGTDVALDFNGAEGDTKDSTIP